jgi:primosomal protein N'
VARVKSEFRYQMLIKATGRKLLNRVIGDLRRFAAAEKWSPTSLMLDIDPITLL